MLSNITFQLALPLAAGQSASQVVAADFDGDGVLDLFIPTINGKNDGGRSPLLFLKGDGAGHYSDISASLFGGTAPSAVYAARVVTGDFNGDGRTDVFVIESGVDVPPFPGGQNQLLLSAPGGKMINATASLPQITIYSHGAAVGDVDNDGDLDIVDFALHAYSQFTPGVGPALQLLVNNGSGGFTLDTADIPKSYQTTTDNPGNTWGALIDVDGDGFKDLVVGAWNASTLPSEVYLNNGRGGFANATPLALPASGVSRPDVVQVEPIDLNGDGRIDLVLSLTNGGDPAQGNYYNVPYLQFLINDGGGVFHDETQQRLAQSLTPASGVTSSWYKFVKAVDVNGDGAPDLLAANQPLGKTTVFLNDGTGHFTALGSLAGLDTPLTLAGAVAPYAFAGAIGTTLTVTANDIPQVGDLISRVLRDVPASTAGLAVRAAIGNDLAFGRITADVAAAHTVAAAINTTSVATLAYEFFTGQAPSAGGVDYLVSPTGPNPNNLNSAYFQSFNIENRYINFAVNLGKAGDGSAAFASSYGGLSFFDATKKAYGVIFGATPSDDKIHAILDPVLTLGGQTFTRQQYFAIYGGDGVDGIGTKAAMVGYLLAEAEKADVGTYAKSNDAFLLAVAQSNAPFGIDLVGSYGKADYVFHG